MNGRTYHLIKLVGTSTTTLQDAINNAMQRAGAIVKNPRWFEVVEMHDNVDENNVSHWQIKMKLGFATEDLT